MNRHVEIRKLDDNFYEVVIVSEGVGAGFSSTCRVAQGTHLEMLVEAKKHAYAHGIKLFSNIGD